jgi:hypothetical protein
MKLGEIWELDSKMFSIENGKRLLFSVFYVSF